jgi:hypothetical protein
MVCAGVTATVKFVVGAETVSEGDVLCCSEPPVPVIVMLEVPAGVLVLVVTVSVLVAPPVVGVTELGLKAPPAPEGHPALVRETGLLNPFTLVRVTT